MSDDNIDMRDLEEELDRSVNSGRGKYVVLDGSELFGNLVTEEEVVQQEAAAAAKPATRDAKPAAKEEAKEPPNRLLGGAKADAKAKHNAMRIGRSKMSKNLMKAVSVISGAAKLQKESGKITAQKAVKWLSFRKEEYPKSLDELQKILYHSKDVEADHVSFKINKIIIFA